MNSDFQRLIAAIREGDRQAADELVRKVEPYLRSAIHLRLIDSTLRRLLDSMDLCQSVLADLFAKGGACWSGRESDDHVRRTLLTMAFNKLVSKARHERRNQGTLPEDCDVIDLAPAPNQVVDDHDLRAVIWSRLSEAERWLFDQNKVKGRTWEEIARNTNELPGALHGVAHDSLRIRLARAIVRVRQELNADGASHAPRHIIERPPDRAG
jgi:DNA-directed RNA polymerase specialized sigma24 family protein